MTGGYVVKDTVCIATNYVLKEGYASMNIIGVYADRKTAMERVDELASMMPNVYGHVTFTDEEVWEYEEEEE